MYLSVHQNITEVFKKIIDFNKYLYTILNFPQKKGVTQNRDFEEIDFVESPLHSLLDFKKAFIKRILISKN